MADYVMLANFTDQGLKAIKGSPSRLEETWGWADAMGGRVKYGYYTLGRYDGVAVVEFPDDQMMLSYSMRVSQMGNVHYTTLRAFPTDEAVKLIQGLP